MLKTIGSTGSEANPKETKGKVGGKSIVGNLISSGDATNSIKRKNQAKMAKSKILIKCKTHDFPKSRTEEAGTGFFTPEARLGFTQLRQAFIEAPIFNHFNPESHIRIETNASDYIIGGVLSQLFSGTRLDKMVTKANLGQ